MDVHTVTNLLSVLLRTLYSLLLRGQFADEFKLFLLEKGLPAHLLQLIDTDGTSTLLLILSRGTVAKGSLTCAWLHKSRELRTLPFHHEVVSWEERIGIQSEEA